MPIVDYMILFSYKCDLCGLTFVPKVMKEFKKRFKYKYDITLDVLLGALSQFDGKTQETPIYDQPTQIIQYLSPHRIQNDT